MARLLERVGSTFENGFGDEGLLAKMIHWAIMAVLIVFSGIAGLILLVTWPVLKIKRKIVHRDTTGSADQKEDTT